MVNKAKDVMQQRIPADFKTKLKYAVTDGSELEGIDNDSIDVVVSIFGVFLIPERDKTLKTIQRVLSKPHGVFGTTAWTSIECKSSLQEEGFGLGFHDTMEESLKGLTSLFVDKNQRDAPPPPWKQWFDPKQIHEMMVVNKESDFESVRVHRSVHSVTWPNPLELWEMLTGNPGSKLKTADPELKEATKQRLVTTLRGDHDDKVPAFLWTASNLVAARLRTTSGTRRSTVQGHE